MSNGGIIGPRNLSTHYSGSGVWRLSEVQIAQSAGLWPTPGNDQYTKLLAHCDGVDATTAFTDISSVARTITTVGNAQVDTAQSKFGGASLLLDGTGDYLSIADAADLELGSGDFTIEMWARPSSVSGLGTIIDKRATAAAFGPFLILRNTTSFQFYSSSNGASYDVANAIGMGTATINTWSHLAIARQGTSIRLFNDGSLINTVTSSATLLNNATALTIGAIADASVGFAGHMDEIRISVGIARWTAAFSPPTAQY